MRMFVFGLGYSAKRIAARLSCEGWQVRATGRDGDIDFADRDAVRAELAMADALLSSVPPSGDSGDPVLEHYQAELAEFGGWTGYLSSTGVYGDAAGAWVDESAPVGLGRRMARSVADARWLALGARVFRLPGIYGPGRSALDRVRQGRAHLIDLPGQVFSRVHVDDIARGIALGLVAPRGAYNLSDDYPCSQNELVEHACALLHVPLPPLRTMEEANLSPMARAFYSENRRVANGKAKRLLGWKPSYPTFREGLAACLEGEDKAA